MYSKLQQNCWQEWEKKPYEDCSSVQKLTAGYSAVHYPYGKVNFLIDKTI